MPTPSLSHLGFARGVAVPSGRHRGTFGRFARPRRVPFTVEAYAHDGSSAARRLREILDEPGCVSMPGVHDALSAKLIARSGRFECAFMSGYGVAASRLGDPDVGLATLGDMVDAGKSICRAAGDMPVVGDGDTGFGGVANVRRTVFEYHAAGFAAVSIEDQVFPKRCAYGKGMRVVPRRDAVARLAAALSARDEIRAKGGDILVIGRTDSRMATNPEIEDNFKEAILRCFELKQLGADAVWMEGPRSGAEMEAFNVAMEGTRTILAQVEQPGTEMLSPGRCAELGYDVALYGLTLLSASAAAIERAARVMGRGDHPTSKRAAVMESGAGLLMPFDDLYDAVGFNEHYALEDVFDGDKFACAEDPGAAECAADFGGSDEPEPEPEPNWTDEVNAFYESDSDDRKARDDQYKRFYDRQMLKNGEGGGFFGDID